MADKPKKPRRDLRARLGRTITPNRKGGAAPVPGSSPGAAVPPGGAPGPLGVEPTTGGIAAPPPGLGAAGIPASVAPPPFARKRDPFASEPPPEPQKVVRLEFDEQLVKDKEVGRGTQLMTLGIAVGTLIAGAVVGYLAGQMVSQRQLYNATVRDGQAVYQKVNDASDVVLSAQRHLNNVARAVTAQGATGASVDYEAIDALTALEKPFEAHDFTNRNYGAFQPNVVNDLFIYMMNVQRIFEEVRTVRAMTAQNRRDELTRSCREAGESAGALYGAVLRRVEGRLMGSLVFLDLREEGGTTQVFARASRGGQPRQMQVFSGRETISEAPEYLALVDGTTSRGVLAEQTGSCGRFLRSIHSLKGLTDRTVEVQGRLTTALGEIARLEEL